MRNADCIIARTVGFEKFPISCKELIFTHQVKLNTCHVVMHGETFILEYFQFC